MNEWRESAKSHCLQAEKIQNFIKAFCSCKWAFQQNEQFGRRGSLPFILNYKTENPVSKSLFETGLGSPPSPNTGTKKEDMFLFLPK